MFSDNNSTESDIGSVEFKKYDEKSTLITFHSAHRLMLLNGISIDHFIVRTILKNYFLGHIEKYKEVINH